MHKSFSARLCSGLLIVTLALGGFAQSALAASVATETLFQLQERAEMFSRVEAALTRDRVSAALVALGVDASSAQERVAALTEEELRHLQSRLDSLPVGGNALAVIGAVFLVLLILELVGVTDIFQKI